MPEELKLVSYKKKASSRLSVISAGMGMTGNLLTSGDLAVEGLVHGDLNVRNLTVSGRGRIYGRVVCAVLTLGVHSEISGDIFANEVRISGQIKGSTGNNFVSEIKAVSVHLYSTAKVQGRVFCQSVSMEKGAQVRGSFEENEDFETVLREARESIAITSYANAFAEEL